MIRIANENDIEQIYNLNTELFIVLNSLNDKIYNPIGFPREFINIMIKAPNSDYIVREDEKSFSSAEHLKDYEMQYEYAVFIEYNSDNQIDENGVGNNKGSAIFLHCHGTKGYTGGCVAVNREDMEFIMKFLNRDKNPKILIREI